tara:strand:- start:3228 stop:4001 length:774 start_codon:yes stop_codon:yes gene_type:complete
MSSYAELQDVFNIPKSQVIYAQLTTMPDDIIGVVCSFMPSYQKDIKKYAKITKKMKNKLLSSSRQPQYYPTNLYFHINHNKELWKEFKILKLFMRNNQGQILVCGSGISASMGRNQQTISLAFKKWNIDSNVDSNRLPHYNVGRNFNTMTLLPIQYPISHLSQTPFYTTSRGCINDNYFQGTFLTSADTKYISQPDIGLDREFGRGAHRKTCTSQAYLHNQYSMEELKEISNQYNIKVPTKFKKNKKTFVQYLLKNY